jgi:hypothetical protein
MHITVVLIFVVVTASNPAGSFAASMNRNEDRTTTGIKTSEVSIAYKGYLFFEIHTANEHGAGTDSNIYITIVGTTTNLTRQILRSMGPSMNAFERNQVDICMLYTNVKFDKTDNIIQGIELINDGRWAGSCKFREYLCLFENYFCCCSI